MYHELIFIIKRPFFKVVRIIYISHYISIVYLILIHHLSNTHYCPDKYCLSQESHPYSSFKSISISIMMRLWPNARECPRRIWRVLACKSYEFIKRWKYNAHHTKETEVISLYGIYCIITLVVQLFWIIILMTVTLIYGPIRIEYIMDGHGNV